MSAVGVAAFVLAGVNCLGALALGAVYWRNHRDIRSPFTLGLMLFALFLLLHNALVLYNAFTMMAGPTPVDERVLLVEQLLQTGAVGALLVATMR